MRPAGRCGSSHGGSVVTLEEAMAISERRLPGEPEDPLADWRASRPPPEPKRETRNLDTAPAPQIDWSGVIRQALKAERSIMFEIIGSAIGDETLGEVEQLIAQAINEVRTELRREMEQLRCRIDTQGSELRGQLEQI